MNLSQVLTEGRRDQFLSKYKSKFQPEELKKIYLLSRDISNNHKFLDFLGKVISSGSVNEDMMKAKIAIEKFIKYQKNLDKKDINQYDSLKDIDEAISKHENKIRREVKQIDGADIVYEDDRFTVVSPKTHEASCYYGSGSKWCTAAKSSDQHFMSYNRDGKLFYFLDKKEKSGSRFYKVAMLQKYDGRQTFFDAPDKSFKDGWILGTPEFEKINNVIQKYMETEYSEEIELFKDEIKAKQEVERLRQRDERIRRARLLRQMEEIRERDDWNPDTNELDDIGRKANAVFSGLRDEWLVNEINEDEDIYNLLPTGEGFYPGDITEFKWLGENETDSEYIVGEWEDVYELAKAKLKDTIDEIGLVESFNEDYLMGYVDKDRIVEFFRDHFEEMVRDNLDYEFESDDLPLSYEQEKMVEELEQEIEELYRRARGLETGQKKDDIFDRIEELEEQRDEIVENPEGEPNEEMIDEKVDSYLADVRYNPVSYIRDYGIQIEDFIDEDRLIEDAVDTDGVGHFISSYDGIEYEVRVDGYDYYVMRVY